MFTVIILVSLCGSLFCLDRVFIQTMISRPVVIAPLVGLLLHNPYAGLIIGALIELIWIDRLPIGTYIPPNDSIAAVSAIAIAAIAGPKLGGATPEIIALSVLIAIPCGLIAKQVDVLIIKSNDILSDRALIDAKENNIRAIEQKNYLGLMKVFSSYFLLLLAFQAVFIPLVIWIYPKLNHAAVTALSFTYYFLPLVGIAVAINMLKLQRAIPVFCAIFLVAAVVLELFHVI
jgi:PTS system mannose-specific IIC component